ncbi:uncharacterized protein LOC142590346 [Dermacentor variabilis]|uniref:uncharacterized protein LOC142590346 n=1 Tax=Dermacentor variabilis TaxID=34621 RepID=UPI003F5BC4F1
MTTWSSSSETSLYRLLRSEGCSLAPPVAMPLAHEGAATYTLQQAFISVQRRLGALLVPNNDVLQGTAGRNEGNIRWIANRDGWITGNRRRLLRSEGCSLVPPGAMPLAHEGAATNTLQQAFISVHRRLGALLVANNDVLQALRLAGRVDREEEPPAGMKAISGGLLIVMAGLQGIADGAAGRNEGNIRWIANRDGWITGNRRRFSRSEGCSLAPPGAMPLAHESAATTTLQQAFISVQWRLGALLVPNNGVLQGAAGRNEGNIRWIANRDGWITGNRRRFSRNEGCSLAPPGAMPLAHEGTATNTLQQAFISVQRCLGALLVPNNDVLLQALRLAGRVDREEEPPAGMKAISGGLLIVMAGLQGTADGAAGRNEGNIRWIANRDGWITGNRRRFSRNEGCSLAPPGAVPLAHEGTATNTLQQAFISVQRCLGALLVPNNDVLLQGAAGRNEGNIRWIANRDGWITGNRRRFSRNEGCSLAPPGAVPLAHEGAATNTLQQAFISVQRCLGALLVPNNDVLLQAPRLAGRVDPEETPSTSVRREKHPSAVHRREAGRGHDAFDGGSSQPAQATGPSLCELKTQAGGLPERRLGTSSGLETSGRERGVPNASQRKSLFQRLLRSPY